jgi:hypothetical protein
MVLSALPEARVLPSGLIAMLKTGAVCPVSVAVFFPGEKSQSLTRFRQYGNASIVLAMPYDLAKPAWHYTA